VSFGSNLLVAQPDVRLGREALEQLEFHVHCDLRHNPTSRLADIVLPVSTAWERESLRVGFEISAEAQEQVQLRPQMIANIGEGRSDHWIVAELAKRLPGARLVVQFDEPALPAVAGGLVPTASGVLPTAV